MKRHLYNVSMFILAPFIGLIYAVTFPIVATVLLWIMGVNCLAKKLDAKALKSDLNHAIKPELRS